MTDASNTESMPDKGAKVISITERIKERQQEQNDRNEMQDQSLAIALGTWIHPSVLAEDVADRVASLTIDGKDSKSNMELRTFVEAIDVPTNIFIEMKELEEFQAMVAFLDATKDRTDLERYKAERKATRVLIDMFGYAYEHEKASISPEEVMEVFEKLLRATRSSRQ